jgi:general stress protein 26
MKRMSLAEIAEKMSGIDIAILSTHSDDGEIVSRPMSNNGDVRYDGKSFYFTREQANCVRHIERDPKVALSFTGKIGTFSATGIYVAVEGRGDIIRDKALFKKHWVPDLENWFEQGVDTPNLVLIRVDARRIKFWDAGGEGEVFVAQEKETVT